MPDYGSLADLNLANAQPRDFMLHGRPQQSAQSAPSGAESILERLRGLVAQPDAYERPALTKDDKRRVLMNAGLALMQSTRPGSGGLFANLGRAGQVGQMTADRIADRKLHTQEASRRSEESYLKSLLGQYNENRAYDADRSDELFNRGATRAKIGIQSAAQDALARYRDAQVDLDRDQLASMTDYRNQRLAQDAASDGSLAAYRRAQIGNDNALTKARIEKLNAETQAKAGTGGLKAGQVRLRNGQIASMSDVRQLYNARYGKWDPMAQQYSFGQNSPTLEQFFGQITTNETDPFSNPNQQATDPLSLR